MSKETIAYVLKQLRIEKGLTADDVGKEIGKSGKTVNGWENGRSQPDIETFLRLCDIYCVDDIFSRFNIKELISENNQISITEHEKSIILAYRSKTDMQKAVDRLLQVENIKQENVFLLKAARSQDNSEPIGTIELTTDQLERLHNAKSVDEDI